MRKLTLLGFMVFLALASTASTSCSRKTGCPAYESTHSKSNRKGKAAKGGSSNLFPKDMRRNMKGR